jgi:DNA invertase Pin-like site-specific DNA recombinase
MGNKKIRAAIYARVSTTEQNPESQLQELRQYVEQRGFLLHKEYVDYVSGSFEKRKKKRKPQDTAYEALMSDARKRLIDCVIVSKYDRFARSLKVLIDTLEEFNQLGIDFISYSQNIDTTTPMGRLFFNIIGSFSDFEREMIVERVNAGLANARAKGVRLGRPEKDPSATDRISVLREEGWSLRQIAKREKLSPAGVLKILRRSKEPAIPSKSSPTIPTPEAVRTEPHVIPEIWQLKIYLLIVKPQVWRRVLVPSNITLAKLSDVLQKLFGWTDLFRHMFVPRDARDFGYELKCDGNKFRLCDVDVKPGGGMLYEYGSLDWTHEISFEKIVQFDQKLQYPVCIAGAMSVPPDAELDGALHYMDVRKRKKRFTSQVRVFFNGLPVMPDPPPDYLYHFDPHQFDLDEINQRLGVPSPQKKLIKTNQSKNTAPLSIPELYQFRVSICGVTPVIWRRVLVRSDSTLEQLSAVINALFDWGGDHLHKFMAPSPLGPGLKIEESSEDNPLSVMRLQPDDSLFYEYDFGDSWMHEIVLEKVSRDGKRGIYPVCTAGKNAGPPEDCGGPEAFMNARNFLSRRKGKRGKAPRGRVSWSEKEFYKENYRSYDPDKFDKDEINQQLAELSKRNKGD